METVDGQGSLTSLTKHRTRHQSRLHSKNRTPGRSTREVDTIQVVRQSLGGTRRGGENNNAQAMKTLKHHHTDRCKPSVGACLTTQQMLHPIGVSGKVFCVPVYLGPCRSGEKSREGGGAEQEMEQESP